MNELSIIVAAIAGFSFGVAFFCALSANAVWYLEGGHAGRAVMLHMARLTGAGALFFVSAQFGAGPLLAALVGFLIARAVMIRKKGGAT